MAEIRWLGHACFRIQGREASIVMDPAGPESGYDIGQPKADIVTVSHDHAGHNALDAVQPGFRAITGPGEYEIKEVFINGIRTYHDSVSGTERGNNTVYLVEIEDLVICHLGDLGHALTEGQSEDISSSDIVLVPVGGGTTIDARTAVEVIGQLQPSIVVPMQYRTERGDADRAPVDHFLKEMGAGEVEPQDRLNIRKADLTDSTQVVVLRQA